VEKVRWTDSVKNEVSQRVKEDRNLLHTVQGMKAKWMVHVLRRNCILNYVTKGKIEGGVEVTGRRGRRGTQLLDDLKERKIYCKLKDGALDRTVWRNRFGRSCGPVLRQTT
jgi:hypothetical protein